MKQLGSGADEAAWNSELVKQLGYIKKHLRYPISRRTAKPIFLFAAMAPGIGFFLIYTVFFTKSTSNYHGKDWLPLLVISAMLIPALATVIRYAKTLRFTAVPAHRSMAENMLLLQQFLQTNNFAIGRHPEMPEVFQIISRGIPSLNGAREVIVFVADDNRILINGHFAGSRRNMSVGRAHHKQMAAMLCEFIAKQKKGTELSRTY